MKEYLLPVCVVWLVLPYASGTKLSFTVHPGPETKLATDEPVEMILTLEVDPVHSNDGNNTYTVNMNYDYVNEPSPIIVQITTEEEYKYLSIAAKNVVFSPYDLMDATMSGHGVNKTVEIQSSVLGRYYVDFYYRTNDDDHEHPLALNHQIKFIKTPEVADFVFTIVLTIGVVLITVNMGIELDLDIIKATLKKPIGPVAGFFSQFIFMPLVAFAMGWFLFKEPLFRLGIFVIGCCPGGTISNFWTLLMYGDVSLSVTMTFISVIAAMGMMPLWLGTLGQVLLTSELAKDIRIPYVKLITSLVMMTIPLAVGMLFRWKFSKYAEFISKKIAKPATWVVCILIVSLGLYSMRYCIYFATNRILLAGAVVALGGYMFGFTISMLCRLKRAQVIAVTMETGIQNAAICLVLMRISFPEPERELASVPVMSQVIFSAVPLYIIWPILMIYRCFFMKKDKMKPLQEKNGTAVNMHANPGYLPESQHM